MVKNNNENIRYIEGIRVVRLYDGNWYCLWTDYISYKNAKLQGYSVDSFKEWCTDNDLIPII